MKRKLIALCLISIFTRSAYAAPQVVADSACEKYAVDIAAFATCENGRVARAETVPAIQSRQAWVQPLVDDAGVPLAPVPAALPRDRQAQTTAGHYLTAQDAHAAKAALGNALMLIDVRDAGAFAAGGALDADVNVPAAGRDARELAKAVRGAIAHRVVDADPLIALLCRDGRVAARAADALTQVGFSSVFVVRGGLEGETGANEAEAAGWRAANLPMRVAAR
jgi:rhodanese-related sulfurtransferase